MGERQTLDELAQSIVSKSKLSTVQRSVDRHIAELDYWLHNEGVRLQVVCDRLSAAGLTRPSGQPLTWRWLGALVARARKRQSSKPMPTQQPAPATSATPPRPAAQPAPVTPTLPSLDVPSRAGRGLESLAFNRVKKGPKDGST